MWNIKPKVEKKIEKTLKIALKLPKSPYFFHFLGKKSFLNQTLGLRKSFLNQTTYVLKNRLYQQSFLNRDSFLNRAFLNRDSTVLIITIKLRRPVSKKAGETRKKGKYQIRSF